jgi:hypothetical protein
MSCFLTSITSLYQLTVCEPGRELKGESYGLDLLHAIGFAYTAKAKQFLASNQSFLGVGGWLHNVQGKYHVFSETYVIFFSICQFLGSALIANPRQRVDPALGNRAQSRL